MTKPLDFRSARPLSPLVIDSDPQDIGRTRAQKAYRLNVLQIPTLRLLGFSLLGIGALLHNLFLLEPFSWASLRLLATILILYPLFSWLILYLFFERMKLFNLGSFFLVFDIFIYILIVYFTGGDRSWLFFLVLSRVADHVNTSFGKVLVYAHISIVSYILMLIYVMAVEHHAVAWLGESAKIAVLYGVSLYLALATRTVEQRHTRTSDAIRVARELILQLEEQSTQLAASKSKVERLSRHNALILGSAGEGIYGVDLQGNSTFVNPATARLSGYAVEELLGQPMHTRLHHAKQDGTPCPWQGSPIFASLTTGAVHRVSDGVLWRKDGTSLPIEYVSTPIREGESIVGAVVTFNDIAERKQLQEQLIRLQKLDAIGRLAGGLAHDFNNLLTVIGGYSDLLVSDLDAGNPLHRHAAAINNAAARATALTRQLLAFSRKQLLQPKVLDLNAVVATMEPMLRRLIGEDIRLVVGLAPALGRVKADPGQLEQVLLNLVVNARDAMPQGGTLTIETTNVEGRALVAHRQASVPPGAYVRLAVRDTGVGMDAATRSHLFEPFFTTKAPGQGTGLGLSTVYGIITQSEGHIAVDSAPAHGATFTIYLPRVEEAIEAGQHDRTRPETPRGRETVLVVEDDASVRGITRAMLELHGYRVLEAGSGEEALEICEGPEGPVQLLLTDVVMPGMSGPEVAQQLTRVHPELKVLYMSGYTDDAILRHGVTELSPAFVQKPFSAETLGWKVREVLEASREEA
jgi:two-component system, cell cycle sensor histidine kinase and response regulator CckA